MRKMTVEFIVICQSAWMNQSGYGIDHSWDGERFATRKAAIKHGWALRGSDDFNVAQVQGDELIWFGWMYEQIEEDADTMRDIAEAVGLTFTPAAPMSQER